ncbi:MAG TPA: DUF6803 family protein [Chitinolyticbacter sp.]|nr:DUF6803 family protein [Chitinolyticbacter sp.]
MPTLIAPQRYPAVRFAHVPMALPVILVETVAITELIILLRRRMDGALRRVNRAMRIAASVYFSGVFVYLLFTAVIPLGGLALLDLERCIARPTPSGTWWRMPHWWHCFWWRPTSRWYSACSIPPCWAHAARYARRALRPGCDASAGSGLSVWVLADVVACGQVVADPYLPLAAARAPATDGCRGLPDDLRVVSARFARCAALGGEVVIGFLASP